MTELTEASLEGLLTGLNSTKAISIKPDVLFIPEENINALTGGLRRELRASTGKRAKRIRKALVYINPR